MDANQRSEFNNQTNNGANEKGTPAAKPRDDTGTGMAQPDLTGAAAAPELIPDSHDRQMATHSIAWGELVDRPADGRDGQPASATRTVSPGTEAGMPGAQYGDTDGNRQSAPENRADLVDASNSKVQRSTDREGSQTGAEGREQGVQDIHQSNDVAGGLPRSPGGTGPRTEGEGYQTGGSMSAEPNPVHESNDAAGGYPRSPGGANKLAGDRKMDDDTGFSRG